VDFFPRISEVEGSKRMTSYMRECVTRMSWGICWRQSVMYKGGRHEAF